LAKSKLVEYISKIARWPLDIVDCGGHASSFIAVGKGDQPTEKNQRKIVFFL
jgi:hypothetical protein